MARNRPNPLDDPPAASSSEEQHHEEEEEGEEEDEEEVEEAGEEDDDEANAQADGSESESEEGEEEEEEEEDEEDEDEEELKKEKEKVHSQTPQPKPLVKNPNSDDDEDDETESDSDPRSPGVSGFTIRKHVATPAAGTPNSSVSTKPKKLAQKPSIDKDEDPSPELVTVKRPADSVLKESILNAKKAKVENGGGEAKKFAINRLWSDQDEIAVLEGIIKFHEERGVNPNSESNEFYEIMKSQLSFDVSKNQLVDKVRRLKKKYWNNIENNVGKGEKGEDPVFSRPHEHQCFQLSKKIWGGFLGIQTKRSSKKKISVNEKAKSKSTVTKDNGNGGLIMDLPKDEPAVAVSNKQEQGKGRDGSFSELYPFLNLALKSNNFFSDLISKDGAEAMEGCLRCLEKSKLDELEGEWKKQVLAEADVHMGRATLLQKQVQLVSDCYSLRG